MGKNYYVKSAGSDANPGTKLSPFKTIKKGVSVLKAGDTLNIFSGTYIEEVRIAGKTGTKKNPIIIQPMPRHKVIIENTLPVGRTGSFLFPNNDWRKASEIIAGAHEDEYVSVRPVYSGEGNFFIRGMFLTGFPYTRLITYSSVDDFRSNNETFEKIFDINDQREKVQVTYENGQPALAPKPGDPADAPDQPFSYPYVYMGPGIWPNRDTGHLHIRLSHTHNNIPGLADYSGTTDPRQVPLGIAFEQMFTLRIGGCSYLTLKNIHVRYGGETTIQCENNNDITLDGLTILCGSCGLINSKSTNLTISNCLFDGGMPTWYFRTDRKNEYYFVNPTGNVETNNLGKNTVLSLFVLANVDIGTKITNNEFLNGHDCTIKGDLDFSRNYINNLNDDALFISEKTGTKAKIYQNVFTRCLYCVSIAEKAATDATPVYIYRNLFDLREPTAGYRPRHTNDKKVWRTSAFLKVGSGDTGIQLFHNTFVAVSPPELHAIFGPFTSQIITQPTASFNNLFAATYLNNGERPKALRFIPPPNNLCKTDGNFFYRASNVMEVLFRTFGYIFNDKDFRGTSYKSLAEFKSSLLFTQSQTVYGPGFEAKSKEGDPAFRSALNLSQPLPFDDFRLKANSPAKNCGVALPVTLQTFDVFPVMANPAAGCYPLNSKPLLVGVKGRKRFPAIAL